MKRSILSIIGGVVFPIVYTVLAGMLTEFFPAYFPDSTTLFGKPAPSLLFAPTVFPIYADLWLASHNFFGYFLIFDTAIFRLTSLVLPVVFIYSIGTWLILRILGIPKRKSTAGRSTPPPPPTGL